LPSKENYQKNSFKGKKTTNITFDDANRKQYFTTIFDRGCFEIFLAQYSRRNFSFL
jgi:hypothetical protein